MNFVFVVYRISGTDEWGCDMEDIDGIYTTESLARQHTEYSIGKFRIAKMNVLSEPRSDIKHTMDRVADGTITMKNGSMIFNGKKGS